MRRMLKVAKQEFKMMAANKVFLIITLLGPIFIIGMTIGPGLLMEKSMGIEAGTKVAILAEESPIVTQLITDVQEQQVELIRYSPDQESVVRQLIEDNQLSSMIILPADYINEAAFDYYSKSGTDIMLCEMIEGSLGSLIIAERMEAAGLDQAEVQRLAARPNLELLKIGQAGGEDESKDFSSIIFLTMGFTMILYMTVLLYGQSIGRSIVKEKTTKTVEIMLSSVSPWELMFGKITGIGFAGLVQYAVWFGLAGIIGNILGGQFAITLPSEINGGNMAFLVTFFVLAYFLYSSLYAAIGSGAEDEQHLGQLAFPVIIFLIVPLVMMTAIAMSPNSALAVGLSLFPLTSPMVMMVRILIDTPPLWQLITCYGLLAGTIVLAVMMSSKIFRVGILMSGKKFKMNEILKWISYK